MYKIKVNYKKTTTSFYFNLGLKLGKNIPNRDMTKHKSVCGFNLLLYLSDAFFSHIF